MKWCIPVVIFGMQKHNTVNDGCHHWIGKHFNPQNFQPQIFKPNNYCISSYSFHGNYSFLNLEIQRSQYIRPKVTVHKGAETIQGRKLYEEIRYSDFIVSASVSKDQMSQYIKVGKLFKGGNYSRAETI